jgi:hypothetical protein
VSVGLEVEPSVPFCLMKVCRASLVVYRAPWRFTSIVLRFGGFEGYSGPVGFGISLIGDEPNE